MVANGRVDLVKGTPNVRYSSGKFDRTMASPILGVRKTPVFRPGFFYCLASANA